MPKEKNVPRRIVFFIFLFYSILNFSQDKIIGNYLLNNNPSNVIKGGGGVFTFYKFYKDGIFKRQTSGELGQIDYGKGHYFIRNDTLVLNYDLTELKEESYFKSKKFYNYKDSIRINLSVYDFNNNPIDNIGVYAYPNNLLVSTNKKGKTVLKLKKEKFKNGITLDLDGDGLARLTIHIGYSANYFIEAFMSKRSGPGFGHLRAYKNQIIKYKILKHTKDAIILETNNNKTYILKKQN